MSVRHAAAWVLLASAVVACGVGFQSEATGSGGTGADGASAGHGQGGPGGPGGAGGVAPGGTGGTGAGIPTGGAGAGGEAAGLTDEGLLVRYFVSEGTSGAATGTLFDASVNGVDLALEPGGNLQWSTTATGAALRWSQPEAPGKASIASVGGTSLASLDGAIHLTFEIVAGPLQSSANNGARLFHAGNGSNGSIAISMSDSHDPVFRLANVDVATWPVPMNDGRHVWHAVLDLDAATDAQKVRLYRDGALVPGVVVLGAIAAQTTLGPSEPFVLGNRMGADRAPAGDVHYFAIYDVELSLPAIAQNVARLAANDD